MTELTFKEQDVIIGKLIEKYQATGVIVDEARGVNLANSVFDVVWLHKSRTHWMCRDANIELSGDEPLIYSINYLQRKYFQDILSAEPMRTKRKINKFLFSQHSCNLTPTPNELIMFRLSEGFEWPLAAICGYAMN